MFAHVFMFTLTLVQKLDLRAQMIRSLHSDLVHFTPKLEVALTPLDPSRPFTFASESLKIPLAAKAYFTYSATLSAAPCFCFCQKHMHYLSIRSSRPLSRVSVRRDNRLDPQHNQSSPNHMTPPGPSCLYFRSLCTYGTTGCRRSMVWSS